MKTSTVKEFILTITEFERYLTPSDEPRTLDEVALLEKCYDRISAYFQSLRSPYVQSLQSRIVELGNKVTTIKRQAYLHLRASRSKGT